VLRLGDHKAADLVVAVDRLAFVCTCARSTAAVAVGLLEDVRALEQMQFLAAVRELERARMCTLMRPEIRTGAV
jgi:hypothetical protein